MKLEVRDRDGEIEGKVKGEARRKMEREWRPKRAFAPRGRKKDERNMRRQEGETEMEK